MEIGWYPLLNKCWVNRHNREDRAREFSLLVESVTYYESNIIHIYIMCNVAWWRKWNFSPPWRTCYSLENFQLCNFHGIGDFRCPTSERSPRTSNSARMYFRRLSGVLHNSERTGVSVRLDQLTETVINPLESLRSSYTDVRKLASLWG